MYVWVFELCVCINYAFVYVCKNVCLGVCIKRMHTNHEFVLNIMHLYETGMMHICVSARMRAAAARFMPKQTFACKSSVLCWYIRATVHGQIFSCVTSKWTRLYRAMQINMLNSVHEWICVCGYQYAYVLRQASCTALTVWPVLNGWAHVWIHASDIYASQHKKK